MATENILQDPPSKLEKYYKYLKSKGVNVPESFDSFQSTLSDEQKRKSYFTYLDKNKDKYGLSVAKDYDSFSKTLFSEQPTEPKKKSTESQPTSAVGASSVASKETVKPKTPSFDFGSAITPQKTFDFDPAFSEAGGGFELKASADEKRALERDGMNRSVTYTEPQNSQDRQQEVISKKYSNLGNEVKSENRRNQADVLYDKVQQHGVDRVNEKINSPISYEDVFRENPFIADDVTAKNNFITDYDRRVSGMSAEDAKAFNERKLRNFIVQNKKNQQFNFETGKYEDVALNPLTGQFESLGDTNSSLYDDVFRKRGIKEVDTPEFRRWLHDSGQEKKYLQRTGSGKRFTYDDDRDVIPILSEYYTYQHEQKAKDIAVIKAEMILGDVGEGQVKRFNNAVSEYNKVGEEFKNQITPYFKAELDKHEKALRRREKYVQSLQKMKDGESDMSDKGTVLWENTKYLADALIGMNMKMAAGIVDWTFGNLALITDPLAATLSGDLDDAAQMIQGKKVGYGRQWSKDLSDYIVDDFMRAFTIDPYMVQSGLSSRTETIEYRGGKYEKRSDGLVYDSKNRIAIDSDKIIENGKVIDKHWEIDPVRAIASVAEQIVQMRMAFKVGKGFANVSRGAVSNNAGSSIAFGLLSYKDSHNSLEQAYPEMDENTKQVFATLLSSMDGLAEAIIPESRYFDGQSISKWVINTIKGRGLQPKKDVVITIAKEWMKGTLGEGVEEWMAMYGSNLVNHAANYVMNSDKMDTDISPEEMMDTSVLGFGMGAIMNIPVANGVRLNEMNTMDFKEAAYLVSQHDVAVREIENAFKDPELMEHVSEDELNKFMNQVKEYQKYHKSLPDDTPFKLFEQIQPLLEEKEKLNNKKKTIDSAFHPEITEQIEELDKKIRATKQQFEDENAAAQNKKGFGGRIADKVRGMFKTTENVVSEKTIVPESELPETETEEVTPETKTEEVTPETKTEEVESVESEPTDIDSKLNSEKQKLNEIIKEKGEDSKEAKKQQNKISVLEKAVERNTPTTIELVNGRPVAKGKGKDNPTEVRKVHLKAVEDGLYDEVPETKVNLEGIRSEEEMDSEMARTLSEEGENPKQIAREIQRQQQKAKDWKDDTEGSKEEQIWEALRGGVSRASFERYADKNQLSPGLRKTYNISKKNDSNNELKLDVIADRLGVDVQDLVDFMLAYPSREAFEKALGFNESENVWKMKQRFEEITGLYPSKQTLDVFAKESAENTDFQNWYAENKQHFANEAEAEKVYDEISKNAEKLANEYDEWFDSLSIEEQAQEMEKTKQDETKTESKPENKGTKSNEDVAGEKRDGKAGKQKARLVRDEKQRKKIDDALDDLLNSINSKLTMGVDPEIMIKGVKVVSAYTEAGIFKLQDILTDVKERFGELSRDLFDAIKSAYGAYRETASEDIYNNLDHNTRNITYESLAYNPDVSVDSFIREIQNKIADGEKLNIVSIRKIADEHNLKDIKDTTLQEYVELAIINEARVISEKPISSAEKFKQIVDLYEKQPTISRRSSERIEKQQYSTPIPMAFLAGEFIKTGAPKTTLEPSAGNGMMLVNVNADNVIANEIDPVRLEMLGKQFNNTMNQDGRKPFVLQVDSVITNPPFGESASVDVLGYNISGLAEQMSINGLNSGKDNVVAAIIIGGHTKYRENGTLGSQKGFLNYLYNYHNVVDVINMDGNLYSKQGTSFPTRMILIAGRKKQLAHKSEYKELDYAPLEKNTNTETVKSFNELEKRVNDAIKKVNDENLLQREIAKPDNDADGKKERNRGRGNDGKSIETDTSINQRGGRSIPDGRGNNGDRGAVNKPESTDSGSNGQRGDVQNTERHERRESKGSQGEFNFENDGVRGVEQPVLVLNNNNEQRGVDVDLSQEKTKYPTQSKSIEIGSVVPTNMAQPLSRILQQFGDIDSYVQSKLGYKTKDELFESLSAEQVDGVAMAIYQIEQGKAMIIGDMTGVGKGRQAAAIIRYAVQQGVKPVFITEKPHLFSDFHRDLKDIGSGNLKPFIINNKNGDSDPTITDENGKVVHKVPVKAEKDKAFRDGIVPDGYDYAIVTYSQLSGVGSGPKQAYLANVINGGIVVMDESHNAGGADSKTGLFFQNVLPLAKGVTFLSATFAKRPDNMPIYALKTAMSDANISNEELINAIITGGVPLQEIMSKNLVEVGQMIRRERDFTGVTIDWETKTENKEAQEKVFDSAVEIFNDIIDFQKNFVNPIINRIDEELAATQGTAGLTRGTVDLGVSNTPFANRAFNLTRQLLFSLKAESIAEEAIAELKAGRKPVIAFGSTMETFINELGVDGDVLENDDYSIALRRGVEASMRYTEKTGSDDKVYHQLTRDDLDADGVVAYDRLIDKISKISVGISISPIDVIRQKLEDAGYTVGELTGRDLRLQKDENGVVRIEKRKNKDKKKTAREFNNGEIDVMMLNQSASTGISLHASETFKDRRQRVMLSAQTQLDVNREVQMRGRIDRTGQVIRGAYRYIISPIPAEQRLIMMFKAKLKSLDANTTSNQKSKTNEIEVVDFLNKYGDEVVADYLWENLDINDKLNNPLEIGDGTSESSGEKAPDGISRKASGRVALLSVAEQEQFYKEVAERYISLIDYLNDNNSNDLEITTLPLNAETLSSTVIAQGLNNGSPFAEDSVREKVEVDVLKKPFSADEVNKSIERNLDGKSPIDYRDSILDNLEKYVEDRNKKEEEAIRNRKVKPTKRMELEADNKGLSAFERQKYFDAVFENETQEKIRVAKEKNEQKTEGISKVFKMFRVGSSFFIPTTADVELNTSYSEGIFLGFSIKNNKFTPSSITADFATLDGRRRVSVPLSKMGYLNSVYAETMRSRPNVSLQNWDSKAPKSNRRVGYIITGNLLQAYGSNKGQLVSYTTKSGEIKQGILMPESYKPENQKMRIPITSAQRMIEDGVAVQDTSGEVMFSKESGGYSISVPSTKVRGGKYFLDNGLRNFVIGNDFRQSGKNFVGAVTQSNLAPMLAYMHSKFGTTTMVQPSSARETQFHAGETAPNKGKSWSKKKFDAFAQAWTKAMGVAGKVVTDAKALTKVLGKPFLIKNIDYLRTPDGTIWGATYINAETGQREYYINPEHLNPETLIHETYHPFDSMMEQAAKDGDKHAQAAITALDKLAKKHGYLDKVKKNPTYADATPEQQRAEARTQMVGEVGSEQLNKSFAKKLKQAVEEAIKWIADKFGVSLKDYTPEQILNLKLEDLVNASLGSMRKGEFVGNKTDESVQYSAQDLLIGAKQLLTDFANRIINKLSTEKDFISYGKVSEGGAKYLLETFGLDVFGYSFIIDNSAVNKVKNEHLGKNEKDKGQNTPLNVTDFGIIAEALSNPTNVHSDTTTKGGLRILEIGYTTNEGDYLITINEARTGRKKLAVKTVFKRKNEPKQRSNTNAPSLRPKTVSASDSSTKIPNLIDFNVPDVKSHIAENDVQYSISLPDNTKATVRAINAEVINGFYSPIENAVHDLKQSKGTGEQMLAILKKVKGVKADELKWTGVEEWLKGQKSVTKEQILDYMKNNRVQIVEVVKEVNNVELLFAEINKQDHPFDLDSYRENGDYPAKTYLKANGVKITPEIERFYQNNRETPKYEKDQADGESTNYKEVMIIMPFGKDVWEEFKNVAGGKTYKSDHWSELNILVHLRMNERTDADGNKVLFVEEVQSDWGQEGREKGFYKTKEQAVEEWKKKAIEKGLSEKPTQEELAEFFMNNPELRKEREKILEGNYGGVNSAPFVTNTEAWTKLGLKVALQKAVEAGADKIAWTTGEQQNERYDLSEQVDSINPLVNADGTYDLEIYKDGKRLKTIEGVPENNVQDYVGKEVAQKIIEDGKFWKNEARKANDSIQLKKLSGLDLQVGGSGMKGFYGSPTENSKGIVGKSAEKLVKELTGENVRVETTTINGVEQHSISITPAMRETTQQGLPQFQKSSEHKPIEKRKFDKLIDRLKKAFPKVANKIVVGQKKMQARLKELSKMGYEVQFLTHDSEALGFVDPINGKVYLNDAKMNANTPIHEIVGHTFLNTLKTTNPKAYNEIMSKLQSEKALMDEVRNDPNYAHLKTDEQVADELFARMVGNEGERMFNEMQDRNLVQKIKDVIADLWAKFKYAVEKNPGYKNIKNWSVEDFQKATLGDIINNLTKDALAGKEVLQDGTFSGTTGHIQFHKTSDGLSYKSESKGEYKTEDKGKNFLNVKAVWNKTKHILFTGGASVKSHADVAHIMRLLENKAVEHAFVVHIDKKGEAHIQFMGVGSSSGVIFDNGAILNGIKKFGTQKIYLVHNHPSGTLMPSTQDLNLTTRIREGLDPLNVEVEHVIMDTFKKEYVYLDSSNKSSIHKRNEKLSTDKDYKTNIMDEQQVLSGPISKITSVESAVTAIQQLRYSALPKNAMLILNRANEVIGNFVFKGEINTKEAFEFLGDAASAAGAIFYGNNENLDAIKNTKRDLNKMGIETLDYVVMSETSPEVFGFYKSYANEGLLYDVQAKYGTNGQANEPTPNVVIPLKVAKEMNSAMQMVAEFDNNSKNIFEAGMDAVKLSDWYNKLTPEQQAEIDSPAFRNTIGDMVKTIRDTKKKFKETKEKVKNALKENKTAVKDLTDFINSNELPKRFMTETEIKRLFKRAADVVDDKSLKEFEKTYQKIMLNVEKRKAKGDKTPIREQVDNMYNSGVSENAIIDSFSTQKEKDIARDQLNRKKPTTKDESIQKWEKAKEKYKERTKPKKLKFGNIKKAVANLLTDRQFKLKNLLKKSGMARTNRLLVNEAGSKGYAKEIFDKVYSKIWFGLNRNSRENLNDIIFLRRISEIEKNREAKGLTPIMHTGGMTGADAEINLNALREKIGDKAFDKLNKKADLYFDTFRQMLKDKYEAGFLTEEAYNEIANLDYSPRKLLAVLLDYNGDVKESKDVRGKLLKDNGIKSLDEGSMDDFVKNSEWLLLNALSSAYKNIARNKVANMMFREMNGEMNEFVFENPIIGTKADGSPKYKYKEIPNFTKTWRWENGRKIEFFMEDSLYQQMTGEVEPYITGPARDIIPWLTGSAIVKFFATGNNPTFFIANSPRDAVFNFINSKRYSGIPIKGQFQSAAQISKALLEVSGFNFGDNLLDKLFEYGLSMEWLSTQGRLKKSGFDLLPPHLRDVMKKSWGMATMQKIQTANELMFRVAIAQLVISDFLKQHNIKSVNDITETLATDNGYVDKQDMIDDMYETATYEARSILDFSRGGKLIKDLELFIPYSNVAVQSLDKIFEMWKEDPVGVFSKTVQVLATFAVVPISMALMAIAYFKDDDDKDKSAVDIYFDTLDGLSVYERTNFTHIPIGKKDENGNYLSIRIAKEHTLTPALTISDFYAQNSLRKMYGKEEESLDMLKDRLSFAMRNNLFTATEGKDLMPPTVRALATYSSGYDFFREQYLPGTNATSKYKTVPLRAEGIENPYVEDFWKEIGKKYDLSPVRTKAAFEAVFTSPSTSPITGMAYGGADVVWSADKSMDGMKENAKKNILKAFSGRIVKASNDYNKGYAERLKLEKEVDDVRFEAAERSAEENKLIRKRLNGEITEKEFKELTGNNKKLEKKYKEREKNSKLPEAIRNIKNSETLEERAMKVRHYYGDIYAPENKAALKELKAAGGIITDDFKKVFTRD